MIIFASYILLSKQMKFAGYGRYGSKLNNCSYGYSCIPSIPMRFNVFMG